MAKIAVLGYGTVGSGVVEVLETNKDSITKRAGREIEVKSVLDLRDFPGDPIQEKIVHDVDVIINDPEIEVVVEVMGGVEPAFTFVKRALEAGKSVCTSNKALVAAHGPELLEMAKKRNLNFMFEASVGGGIPIIRPLNQSLTADEITKITGILNGTTNYILTKMDKEGSTYEETLKEAQELGYAERNPEADVVDCVKHKGKNVMTVWSVEKLELGDADDEVRKFFVRVKGNVSDLSAVNAAFGNVQTVTVDGIDGEFGFITEPMSERAFAEAAKKIDMIHRIRIDETTI